MLDRERAGAYVKAALRDLVEGSCKAPRPRRAAMQCPCCGQAMPQGMMGGMMGGGMGEQEMPPGMGMMGRRGMGR